MGEVMATQQRRGPRRVAGAIVAGVLGVTAGGMLFGTPAGAATYVNAGFSVQAWGSDVAAVGNTVRSGPTSYSGIGCTSRLGLVNTNTSAAIDVPGIAIIGAVNTNVETYGTATSVSDRGRSNIASTNLLGGLIQASAVTSTSIATATATSVTARSTSTLLNARVAGVPIAASVAPNTTINLSFGRVVLNQQIVKISGSTARSVGVAIHVYLTSAAYGLGAGSQIYVGYTTAQVNANVTNVFGGEGFGTQAYVGSTVKSGPTARVYVPCFGGTSHSTVAADNTIPGVLDTGVINTTATSLKTDTTADAKVTVNVASTSLLAGAVSATGINAVAHVRGTVGQAGYQRDTTGSGLLSLSILGVPVTNLNPPPNTQLPVLGIGTLTLNKTTIGGNSIHVTMIELKITQAGLAEPVGTLIDVADAQASVSAH